MSSPMRQLLPHIYWAGKRFLKPGVHVWVGPKPKAFDYQKPWWRRGRHIRILPVPKAVLR